MKFKKSYLTTLHFLLINPALNMIPFFLINVFYDNQSYIGNQLGHRFYLLAWALSSASGFYFYSKKIWDKNKIHYNHLFHLLICLCMFISCMIPYSNNFPFWINDLHIWLAIISVSIFILEWINIYFKNLPCLDHNFCFHLKTLYILFSFCALVLFMAGHVTAFSELLFSGLINIYLGSWYIQQKKKAN